MRKFTPLLWFVLLTAYTAYPQLGYGTVVVINSSKDKLVVAADSRAVYNNQDRPPDDSQCKFATFDHKVLFATGSVAVRWRNSADDPVGDWRNVDLAGVAVNSIDETLQGEERIHAIGQKWSELLVEKRTYFYQWHPASVIQMATEGKGILAYSLFALAWEGTSCYGSSLV